MVKLAVEFIASIEVEVEDNDDSEEVKQAVQDAIGHTGAVLEDVNETVVIKEEA